MPATAQTPTSPIEDTLQEDDFVDALRYDKEQAKMDIARRAYESHHQLPPNYATEPQVIHSAAGVEGWMHFGKFLARHEASKDHIVQSGPLLGMVCANACEARLVERLAELNAGFRDDEPEQPESSVDSLVSHLGKPDHGSLFLCEAEIAQSEVLVNSSEWVDVEFEVALDSGSTDHVCHSHDTPGYLVEASAGSKAGQGFIVGNGQRVPNEGQINLNLQTGDTNGNTMSSTFQVAKVSRPLMSVGRLCDAGMDVLFKKDPAEVLSADGAVILSFERQPGGLYVAKLRLKRPSQPFGRQE